jgi:geranylgeranyl pyrophosphate synthase
VSLRLVREAERIRNDHPIRVRCGEAQAINAGDLALSLALGEAAKAGAGALCRVVAWATEGIEKRTARTSSARRGRSASESGERIDGKTGAVLAHACELGAIAADASEENRNRLGGIGGELDRALEIRGAWIEVGDGGSELGELDRHLERAMRAWEELPCSENGRAWMQEACDFIRSWVSTGGGR